MDGKILKPAGWQAPDIKGILARHQDRVELRVIPAAGIMC